MPVTNMRHESRFDFPNTQPVLLVVDDDPVFCALVKHYAGSKYQVFESLSSSSIDTEILLNAAVVVLDLNMPGSDGVELIKTLAALTPRPQLLIASGYEQRIIDLAKKTAEIYGFESTAVIQKPIDGNKFLDKLEMLNTLSNENGGLVSSQARVRSNEEQIYGGMLAGEFMAYYQPQIDVASSSVTGVEALARWQHPQFGIVTPASFIEIIELSTMALDFTLLIMESAMQDYINLRDSTGYAGTLSVNVPPDVFANEQFADMTLKLAYKYNFPLSRLVCEITERGMEKMRPETMATMTRLKMHNVLLSVDDFGTGQSGLSKLKSKAFDEIKIDRSFIQDLSTSNSSRVIVDSILKLASQTGLRVVAEGVETEETLMALQQLGPFTVQGYYFAKPLPINQLITFVSSWKSEAEAVPSGG